MDQISELSGKLDRKETLSAEFVLSCLRHCRRNRIPAYELILASSPIVISSYSHLPDDDDILSAFEQIFEAAIFQYDISTAQLCLDRLQLKFPVSSRVARLEGLMLESSGDNERALEIYDEILVESPTNTQVHKRKIAILRSQPQKLKETLKAFNDYLQLHQTDLTAWLALSDVYLSYGHSEQASFCLEEAILLTPALSPSMSWLHNRLALIYASNPANLTNERSAMKHLLRALESTDNKISTHLAIIHVADVLISANHGKKTEMDELEESKLLLNNSLTSLLQNDIKIGKDGIAMSAIFQRAFGDAGKRQKQQGGKASDSDHQVDRTVIESKNAGALDQPEID